jgi:FYVE zinc finger
MGSDHSAVKVEKLKSKTFRIAFERTVLSIQEYKQRVVKEWEIINLVLHHSILSTYINKNLEKIIEINKDVYVSLNSDQEIVLVFDQDKVPVVWKFRGSNLNSLNEWFYILMVSKRPVFVLDISCQVCKQVFGSFLRKHHCRNCGKIVCNNCSNTKVVLENMGYSEKKRVCSLCKQDLNRNKLLF